MKKEAIPVKRVAPMQAFVFNQRRKQFQDPRVRRAFALAFNFEEANKKLFYDLYVRVGSYFDNSELASKGLPQGRELEILNEVKSEVPPEVFTTEWKNPVNATPEDFRNHMREASKLLAEAGWTIQEVPIEDGQLRHVLLHHAQRWAVVAAEGQRAAQRAGRNARAPSSWFRNPTSRGSCCPTCRTCRSSASRPACAWSTARSTSAARTRTTTTSSSTTSPSRNRPATSSATSGDRPPPTATERATQPASRTRPIDKLIDKVVFAKDRDELLAATHALDRVLLWNFYVVPQWHYPFERVAYWDVFGRPEKLPSQTSALSQVWWYDADKQKALAGARGQ